MSYSGMTLEAPTNVFDFFTWDADCWSTCSKVSSYPGVLSERLVMFWGNMMSLNYSKSNRCLFLLVSNISLIYSSFILRQSLLLPSSSFLNSSLNFLIMFKFAFYRNISLSSWTANSYASSSFSLKNSSTSSRVMPKPSKSTPSRFSLNCSICSAYESLKLAAKFSGSSDIWSWRNSLIFA